MKFWVFKINTRRGWEFDTYFNSRARRPYELGDEGWIRSASSLRYLREEVKRGDLFLCYEVDRKRMLGLACAASDGRDIGAGSLLDFCPPHEAVRLKNPLKRHPDLDHILAFTPHSAQKPRTERSIGTALERQGIALGLTSGSLLLLGKLGHLPLGRRTLLFWGLEP